MGPRQDTVDLVKRQDRQFGVCLLLLAQGSRENDQTETKALRHYPSTAPPPLALSRGKGLVPVEVSSS